MASLEQLEVLRQGVEAWNTWRRKWPQIRPDLSRANLRSAYLFMAHLNGADLFKADLRCADLGGADLRNTDLTIGELSGANLVGANLNLADLSGADLSGANLRCADLRCADLGGAKLSGAKLGGAEFSGAVLSETLLANTDLSEVKGLESVIHRGPSTIGIDSFFRSRGKIPEVFLRGAGVPDSFIQCASSLADATFEFFSCFISYSHADKAFARRLHDALQGSGIRCWLDEKRLLPGDHIHREVDEAVRLWDKVLLCCSKASLASWWVDKEISKALKKEEQLWKERNKQVLAIIPLNLDGYMLDPQWQDWKKQHLTDRVAPDFTGWEKDNSKFEAQFERVIKALRADAGARGQPPKSRL
jgi:uncharacterized protein YjbI with pentapeptide repeats